MERKRFCGEISFEDAFKQKSNQLSPNIQRINKNFDFFSEKLGKFKNKSSIFAPAKNETFLLVLMPDDLLESLIVLFFRQIGRTKKSRKIFEIYLVI